MPTGAQNRLVANDRKIFADSGCKPFRGFRLALPVDKHAPAANFELTHIAFVPVDGCKPLCLPELGIRFRHNAAVPAGVGMPVATVNENDGVVLRKNEVRLSGQILSLQTKAQAEFVAGAADAHLRLRVAAFDPRHVVRASVSVVYVQQLWRDCASLEETAGVGSEYHARHAFNDSAADGFDYVWDDAVSKLPIRLRIRDNLRKLVLMSE